MEWMLNWDIAHTQSQIRQTGSSRPLRKIKSRRGPNAASPVCARNGAKTLNLLDLGVDRPSACRPLTLVFNAPSMSRMSSAPIHQQNPTVTPGRD